MPPQQQHKQLLADNSINFSSTLKVIGYYPPLKKTSIQNYIETLQFDPNAKSFIPHNVTQTILKSNCMFTKVKVNPVKVVAEGNTIGLIDENHNAWVVSEIFQSPVNLSLLIKKRVSEMFINEKEVILKTKKGLILINWGAKKLFENESLLKISIFDSKTFYQNFFEAFSILDGTPNDIFYMSNMKKSQNSNKMYRITQDGNQIHGYPTLEKFNCFSAKIVGISVSKYHSLCWDQTGGIYSWGTRSLALGFQNLPDEDLVTQPTRLNFNFLVKSAYASNHYSLALSYDGKLYEWGIKKEVNELNEQLIFQPRLFSFKYFNCQNKKFTTLKGKNEKFGVICSNGELYVWGEKAKIFVDPNASIPKQWQNGRLYEPYPVHSPEGQKIIDFFMEENYLSIVTIPKECKYQIKGQLEYWGHVMETVRTKFNLKKYRKIKTQANLNNMSNSIRFSNLELTNDGKQNRKKSHLFKKLPGSNTNRNRLTEQNQSTFRIFLKSAREDKISKAQIAKKSKQKYIQMAKDQEKFFTYVMKPLKNQKIMGLLQGDISKRDYKKNTTMIATGLNFYKAHSQRKSLDEVKQTKSDFYETLRQKMQFPEFLKDVDDQKLEMIKKKRRIENKKLMNFTMSGSFMKKRSNPKNYDQRLQEVLQKKKLLETMTFKETMKKLQENSLQHRMKRHMEIQIQKEKEEHHQILKNTLLKFLIKSYVVKLVAVPLSIGRQIKIQNFARNLKFERIEKNIRKIFIKAKVRFGMKKLQTLYFSRFALLTIEWRRYVKKFRQKKYIQNKKIIVEEITKYFTKDKIKLGLSTSNLNIRKIQKLREWLVIVKNERMKCLKYLWKIHLFSIMKISPDNESVVVCHLPKNTEDITFESLYNEKVQQNPNLKLETFLNKSPLFKIKVEYFRTVANLFTEQKKPLHKSEKIINYLAHTKRARIKFLDSEEEQKNEKEQTFKINILNGDICPYSLHYNIFIKPKNYDITISQMMKKSEKWIKEQKQILQRILQSIIHQHQRAYIKKRQQYDEQLARFIRTKYQVFSEKRWRYIIEYNQIQKSLTKKKKEKELFRIMDLIGMVRLLEQDCIPEKHVILDQALKRKDAPKVPNNHISFGQREFREAFKLYYDHVYTKAKQMRKVAVN